MWVQLKSLKHIEVQGEMKTYRPGDWVDVGKQTALLWISEGSAWVPEGKAADLMGANCGVLVLGNETRAKEALGDYVGKIEIKTGSKLQLPWPKTLIYNPDIRLRKELVPVGFHLLDVWQAAIPLWDYNKLASDQGEEDDRGRTAAVVHDLRVPLYSPHLLFLRRCGDTQRLVDVWEKERARGDDRFALLRAIYIVKPFVLALPTTWIFKDLGL